MQRVHPDFVRQMAPLAVVAGRAGRDHVLPRISTAARHRNDVIARQEFTATQLRAMTAAILTAVMVARKKERVRDLPAELARDVNKAGKTNDDRARHLAALRMENAALIDLEDFGLLIDDQSQRPADRQNRE